MPIALRGSQAALATLADQARRDAILAADAAFQAACAVICDEQGVVGHIVSTPDGWAIEEVSAAWEREMGVLAPLIHVEPDPAKRITRTPPKQLWTRPAPVAAAGLDAEEQARYEAMRASSAAPAPAGPSGTETAAAMLASTGTDFGAFGANYSVVGG